MTEITNEYLNEVREKVNAYNYLSKLIQDGLVEKVVLDKFDGVTVVMPLVKMYIDGWMTKTGADSYIFITKYNGDYEVYNVIKDARLIIKGYVTVETYEYETTELSEAKKALLEIERQRRESMARTTLTKSIGIKQQMHYSMFDKAIDEEVTRLYMEKYSLKHKLKKIFKWPY